MTRQPHDQFAKAYLKELLEPLGTVEVSREIPGETLQIDLFFDPSPEPLSNPPPLGLLGQLASTPCLWEPFRNCPSKREISNCVLKLLYIHGEFYRKAKRDPKPMETQTLPTLWILTPTVSEKVLELCGAHSDAQNWCTGVYRFAELFHTGIIAINQLPETPETLWLRLLGKGGTQRRAIQQVLDLPEDDSQRRNILELIGVWRINVQAKIDLSPEDQELVMELSPAYLKWREDTIRQGIREGIQQGIQEGIQQGIQEGIQQGVQQAKGLTIETLLRTRFGSLDEELMAIIDSIMELSPEEFIPICMQGSREELLARFTPEH